MANNYYDATGVLVLDRVTPVITALFGGFKLDETYPGNGEAYIAVIAEDCNPTWDHVLQNLGDLADHLGLSLPQGAEATFHTYVHRLVAHFGGDKESLPDLADIDPDDPARLRVLFNIATRMDDGHGLKALKFEGCWHSSNPRLFEFGGNGQYLGRHCSVVTSSTTALDLGADIDSALDAKDLSTAADRLVAECERILSGVSNEQSRHALRQGLAELLLARQATATGLKWFAVAGCIPGDEETCHIFHAVSREQACAAFKEALWEGEPKARREAVWNEHGAYVYVQSIVSSNALITAET